MLNIDDRLIKEVLPKIKPNAFSVLLSIAIHLNKKSDRCFPSIERLCLLTGLSKDTVYGSLKILRENNLLASHQEIDSTTGRFGKRTFAVTTRFISIFVTAQDAEPLPEKPYTEKPVTGETVYGKTGNRKNQKPNSLNNNEHLNNEEQINNVGVAHAHEAEEKKDSFVDEKKSSKEPPGPLPPDYSDYPKARSSQELVKKLREFFEAHPLEWRDGVLEQGRATKWPKEKIADCVIGYCAYCEREGMLTGRTYQQYKGGLVRWFLDQPRFERTTTAQPTTHVYSSSTTYPRLK